MELKWGGESTAFELGEFKTLENVAVEEVLEGEKERVGSEINPCFIMAETSFDAVISIQFNSIQFRGLKSIERETLVKWVSSSGTLYYLEAFPGKMSKLSFPGKCFG